MPEGQVNKVVFLDVGHGRSYGYNRDCDPGAMSNFKYPNGQLALIYEEEVVRVIRSQMMMHLRLINAKNACVHIESVEGDTYKTRHAGVEGRMKFLTDTCRTVSSGKEPVMEGLYIQLHLNAGNGQYSLVIHDDRSHKGEESAKKLIEWLEVPGIKNKRTGNTIDFPRARGCIGDIWPIKNVCGVVYEPAFIDTHMTNIMELMPGMSLPTVKQSLILALTASVQGWIDS